MKCSIGQANLKTFSRIIRFLAKISVEIHLEAIENEMALKAVNASKTSFVIVRFPKPFFSLYHATDNDFDNNHCSLSVKPLLSIFKGFKVSQSCIIELDGTNSKLIIEFTNKFHTKKTHLVTILEHEKIENFSISDSYPNTIICRPHLFHSILVNFPKAIRELSFEVKKDLLILKNHIDYPEKDVETVRLKTAMKKGEFSTYDIGNESTVIFTTQDFKSIIYLAEIYQIPVKICFSDEGNPFVVSIQNEGNFSAQLVVATLKERTLRLMRKPKSITNYKDLVNSFLAGNKRKIRNSDMTDQARNAPKKFAGLPLQTSSLTANSRPEYTDSELRREILSPDIPETNTPTNPSARKSHSIMLPPVVRNPRLSSVTLPDTNTDMVNLHLTESDPDDALLLNLGNELDEPMDISTPHPEKENNAPRRITGHTNESATTSKTPQEINDLIFKNVITPLKTVDNSNGIANDWFNFTEDSPILSRQKPPSDMEATPEISFSHLSRAYIPQTDPNSQLKTYQRVKKAHELNKKLFAGQIESLDYGVVLVADSDEEM